MAAAKEQVVSSEMRMRILQIARAEMDMSWKGVWLYLTYVKSSHHSNARFKSAIVQL